MEATSLAPEIERSPRQNRRWRIGLALLFIANLGVAFPYFVRLVLFGDYLDPKQVAGVYVRQARGIEETITIKKGKYFQELRLGGMLYTASGRIDLNQTGAVIFHRLYEAFEGRDAPNLERQSALRWRLDGTLTNVSMAPEEWRKPSRERKRYFLRRTTGNHFQHYGFRWVPL